MKRSTRAPHAQPVNPQRNRIHPRWRAWALALGGLLALGTASAGVPSYDNFSSADIDRSKWNETETWRYIDAKGRLTMGRYLYGSNTSNVGLTVENQNLSVTAPVLAKTLKATVAVTEIDVSQQCAANPAITYARARLIGSYFNIRAGGPVAGDRTGDVLAQARIGRASNSTDPADVLRVQGVLTVCGNFDCSASQIIGSVVDLGTATLGSPVKLQIDWEKKNKRFVFSRDAAMTGEVTYTDADTMPPVAYFNNVSLRNEVANCASGPKVKAGLGAWFDNIGIAP